jgi:hypothetical protein
MGSLDHEQQAENVALIVLALLAIGTGGAILPLYGIVAGFVWLNRKLSTDHSINVT